MGNESESSDLDREVDDSMRLFQRSQVGESAPITPIRPARVLLVLDGSSQDDTSIRSAAYLRDRFDVETLLLDAREGSSDADHDLAVQRAGEVSGGRPIARKAGASYDAILAALSEHDVDIVVVPCPFGRSFVDVGSDSAGTVIDVLLSRCGRPLLVTRRDDQALGDCVGHVSLLVGAYGDVEMRAAAWAFGRAGAHAEITLNLVVDKEQFENIRSIVEALTPDTVLDSKQFAAALTKAHHVIHGAMAKTASQQGMTYRLLPQAGEIAPPNPLHSANLMLLVMPLEVDDRFGQGFVQDRIRRSPHPVLIVPGHVRPT
jgi:hypothetical protein